MGDERENMMNLDLNLGPLASDTASLEPGSRELLNLEEWVAQPIQHRIREALWGRSRRWRGWRRGPLPSESQVMSHEVMVDPNEAGAAAGNEDDGVTLQTGEGSVAAEERDIEADKTCDSNVAPREGETTDKKEDVEKKSGNEGSFFDCNICLDLAREPVVTCCGHLFCWSCLYRWLHIHSDAKECPVCKGEVTVKNVTPIYGRGNFPRAPEEDLGVKIPVRPSARRVESLRQAIQRSGFSFPMEEMILRLGSRFDLTRDILHTQETDSARETLQRSNSLLNRILTSRGLRREQNVAVPPDDVVDLTQDAPPRPEETEHRGRMPQLIYRRGSSHRGSSRAAAAMSSAERLVDTYFRGPTPGRSQEQPLPVDDRDSFSSIAAVIHGESQTVDTAIEIDSMVSLSTSSSRRRNDASRVSDVDSGDSRPPRRRRLD